jgi:hypothetical protein
MRGVGQIGSAFRDLQSWRRYRVALSPSRLTQLGHWASNSRLGDSAALPIDLWSQTGTLSSCYFCSLLGTSARKHRLGKSESSSA